MRRCRRSSRDGWPAIASALRGRQGARAGECARFASAHRARRLPLRRRRTRERRRQPAEPDARGALPACRTGAHRGDLFPAPGAARRRRVRRPAQDPRARHQAVPDGSTGCSGACVRRSCIRATSRRWRRASRRAFARRTGPRPWRARARRRRPRRNESDLPMGAPHVPAVRHAVRRAVAGPRALPDGLGRRACAADPADHQWRRHRGVHAATRCARRFAGCPFARSGHVRVRNRRTAAGGEEPGTARAGVRAPAGDRA